MLNLDLNVIGQKIVADARATTKKDTNRLANSIRYSVKGSTLTLTQLEYGQYQTPNALEVSVEKVLDKEVDSIINQITDYLLTNFK